MSEANQQYLTQFVNAEQIQLASVFASKHTATRAIEQVVKTTDVAPQQVMLIEPDDSEFNRKLEGDSKAIGKMMWYSHLLLGVAGLAVGLITAYLLVNIGPALTRQNPVATYIAFISPGIFIGLFVAGLLSLRPDRTQLIEVVRQAVKARKYAVVVNMREGQSVATVREYFSRHGHQVVESIQ